MSTTAELTQYAKFLRNAAPQAYADFCTAFEKYTGEAVKNMLNATTDLSVTQGQAQQCAKILKVLEDVKNG